MNPEKLYEAVVAIEKARVAMIEVQRCLMDLDVHDSKVRAKEAAGAAVKLSQWHRRLLSEALSEIEK